LIKTDKTERFTTALEEEPQNYRHFFKRTHSMALEAEPQGCRNILKSIVSKHFVQHCYRVGR